MCAQVYTCVCVCVCVCLCKYECVCEECVQACLFYVHGVCIWCMCTNSFVVCCLATLILKTYISRELGEYKVARVGRHTTDYKIVIRPWKSGI